MGHVNLAAVAIIDDLTAQQKLVLAGMAHRSLDTPGKKIPAGIYYAGIPWLQMWASIHDPSRLRLVLRQLAALGYVERADPPEGYPNAWRLHLPISKDVSRDVSRP